MNTQSAHYVRKQTRWLAVADSASTANTLHNGILLSEGRAENAFVFPCESGMYV